MLGPYLVKQHYGGALSWGFIGGAEGVGAVLGGLAALRIKPRRIVLASCLWSILYGVPTLVLGLLLPLPFVVAAAFVQGFGLALHLTLWFTAFQQQVPEEALSRVSSYDAIGSFTLIPLGTAAAGIVAGVDRRAHDADRRRCDHHRAERLDPVHPVDLPRRGSGRRDSQPQAGRAHDGRADLAARLGLLQDWRCRGSCS